MFALPWHLGSPFEILTLTTWLSFAPKGATRSLLSFVPESQWPVIEKKVPHPCRRQENVYVEIIQC